MMPISAADILALSASICIAFGSMLTAELRGRVSVQRLGRWQLTTALALTASAGYAVGGWSTVDLKDALALGLSGFFGIVLASTTYYAAIYKAGPSVTALLFSLASPLSLFFAYLFFGETISARQLVGIALILSGILIALMPQRTTLPVGPDAGAEEARTPPRQMLAGVALGLVTALGQALGYVAARPAMAAGAEPFTAMAIRIGLGVACYWIFFLFASSERRLPPIRPRDGAIAVAAAISGTGLGMSLIMMALKTGNVGIVSTLSSMTPIAVLPMVWLRSGKSPSASAWIGALVAIGGTALTSIGG